MACGQAGACWHSRNMRLTVSWPCEANVEAPLTCSHMACMVGWCYKHYIRRFAVSSNLGDHGVRNIDNRSREIQKRVLHKQAPAAASQRRAWVLQNKAHGAATWALELPSILTASLLTCNQLSPTPCHDNPPTSNHQPPVPEGTRHPCSPQQHAGREKKKPKTLW